MQKPNVLFISSWYPTKEHETLGNFVQRHAECINPLVNLEVLTVISSANYQETKICFDKINDVKTTIVYYPKVKNSLPLLSQWIKYRRYLNAFKHGYEAIKKRSGINRFDLNHTNVCYKAGIFSMYLKKKEGLQYILTEHWTAFLPYRNEFQKFSPFVKSIIRKVVRQAKLLVPVSNHLATSMAYLGLVNKYEVIPNVVDVDLFQIGEKVGDKFTFLHVSTLDNEQKNIDGIFQAFEILSRFTTNFKLVIVTDGDINEGRSMLEKSGLNTDLVEFHGTKTPVEIAEFYKKSDCFLLFSNYENLPCVIVESMSAGLPVISTKIAGIPEHVDDSKGILIKPKNIDELVYALKEIINKNYQYQAQEIRSYAIENFSKNAVGEKYFQIYQQVISDHVS